MKNWIETYQLENGDVDISDVNKELVSQIPSARWGKYISD